MDIVMITGPSYDNRTSDACAVIVTIIHTSSCQQICFAGVLYTTYCKHNLAMISNVKVLNGYVKIKI